MATDDNDAPRLQLAASNDAIVGGDEDRGAHEDRGGGYTFVRHTSRASGSGCAFRDPPYPGWYVFNDDGTAVGGPYDSRRAAIRAQRLMHRYRELECIGIDGLFMIVMTSAEERE